MRKIVFGVCLGIVLLPGLAGAQEQDEVTELKKVLGRQRRKIERLVSRIDALDAKLAKQEQSAGEAKEVKLPKAVSWIERIKFYGDLRYRHELIQAEGKEDRNRQRVRARVGLKAKVAENVDVGFQIATGSNDPVSTNQTLDGGFSSKGVWVDIACFDWHPGNVSGLHVIGGKMKNPFHKPGKTELIWDGDLRPEGCSIKYSKKSGNWKFFTNIGGFWVEERSSDVDTKLLGAQAGVKYSFPFLEDKGYLQVGGSYYDYQNMKGKSPIHDAGDPFGNTVDIAGNYGFDYDLFESFVELGFKMGDIPVLFFGNYVTNIAEDVQENRGWLAGTTIGKCKKPHSCALRYNIRDLEADAVLGVFTDSDFNGGGTDGAGHEFGFNYQIAKRWKAGVSYFYNERETLTDKKDYKRMQLDLALKF